MDRVHGVSGVKDLLFIPNSASRSFAYGPTTSVSVAD